MPDKSQQELATCWIHRQDTIPVLFLHEHHRHPQAYGGEDDPANLVWLCTGCHDLLHRLATMISSGKSGQVADAMSQYLPNSPAARERLATLVQEVVEAKVQFKAELASTENSEAPIDVVITLSRSVHAKLRTMSQDYVHKSGRRSGLAAYIETVLTHHAEHRDMNDAEDSPDPQPTRKPRRV